MAEKAALKDKLRKERRKVFEESDVAHQSTTATLEFLSGNEEKYGALSGIPADIIRKAWFTSAHLLLSPGAVIADMGCGNGIITYALAALNPQLEFIGIDKSKRQINKAQKKWELPNLEFRHGTLGKETNLENNSLDAVINSFILHDVYSSSKYHESAVLKSLESQFALLKQEGLIFIHDYAKPPPEEYVLMEMPDLPNKGSDLSEFSEANLLTWYSEHARPTQDQSCHGFFLEELPPRFPKTRLFRLPYKWAYEFVMRKDNREEWETELSKEYTFFTQREYRKYIRSLGARVLYTAPHWDTNIVRDNFEGHFKLYDDNGNSLGSPPTSFIAVAQKIKDKESLRLTERRPSQKNTESNLRISAMRNNDSGTVYDIVSRDMDITDVLPYHQSENGDLYVYVHEGVPRGVANSVPRSGKTLDGKGWSGHMTEAISVPTSIAMDAARGDFKETVRFSRDYLGLKPSMGASLEQGPSFFPAPDFIDEMIQTRYLRVTDEEGKDIIEPRSMPGDAEGFTTKGRVRRLNAQSLLNAISVGFIPNSRLEMQIEALYKMLDTEYESWSECPLVLSDAIPEATLDTKEFAKLMSYDDKRFKKVKGTTGTLRSIQSIFVDEGWVEGGITGLKSSDIEFVVSDEHTINKVVVMPLTRHAQTEEVMLGVVKEYLPVPQRYKGNGLSLRLPSYQLPKDVQTIDQAKRFIADEFGTTPDNVARLGESYFCHVGVTPMRIYPFAVSASKPPESPMGGPVEFAPLRYIGQLFGYFLDFVWDVELYSKAIKLNRQYSQDTEAAMNITVDPMAREKDRTPVTMSGSYVTGFNSTMHSSSGQTSEQSSTTGQPSGQEQSAEIEIAPTPDQNTEQVIEKKGTPSPKRDMKSGSQPTATSESTQETSQDTTQSVDVDVDVDVDADADADADADPTIEPKPKSSHPLADKKYEVK